MGVVRHGDAYQRLLERPIQRQSQPGKPFARQIAELILTSSRQIDWL